MLPLLVRAQCHTLLGIEYHKQTLDTQEALVSQYQGTLAANQAAVNEARLNLEFTLLK